MLKKAFASDLMFLAEQGLIDYSLLVGVHMHEDSTGVPTRTYEAMNVVTVRDDTRHCYLGIIDILTPYSSWKVLETYFTGKLLCRNVSCQPPSFYANRFLDFVVDKVLDACG